MQFRSKNILILAGLVAGFFTGTALAIDLGEITINSSLDEPLEARIDLLELDGLDVADIVATLGLEDDYLQTGMERSSFIDLIELEIELSSGAEGSLILTSTDAVTESSLNLVLNITWPAGSLMREYVAIVEVPTFTENASLTPNAPETATNDDSILIQDGDTLWALALQARDDSDISVQQMMLALQNANPDAFINNNINRIRSGKVLRVPSRQEIISLSQERAMAQVAIQNQQLALSPVTPASGLDNETISRSDEGDELSVLTEIDSDLGNTLGEEIARLENELALSEESEDRARIENEELNSRLADLEAEIDILEDIMVIEETRIAQLQAELANQVVETSAAVDDAQEVVNALEVANAEETTDADVSLMERIKNLFKNPVISILVLWIVVIPIVIFLIWWSRKARTQANEELDTEEVTEDKNASAEAVSDEVEDSELSLDDESEEEQDKDDDEDLDETEDSELSEEQNDEEAEDKELLEEVSGEPEEDEEEISIDLGMEEDSEDEAPTEPEDDEDEISIDLGIEDDSADEDPAESEDDENEISIDLGLEEDSADEASAEPDEDEEEISLDLGIEEDSTDDASAEPEEDEISLDLGIDESADETESSSEADSSEKSEVDDLDDEIEVEFEALNSAEDEVQAGEPEQAEESESDDSGIESVPFSIVDDNDNDNVVPINPEQPEVESSNAEKASNDESEETEDYDDFLDFGNLKEDDFTDESEGDLELESDEDILQTIIDGKDETSTKLDLAVAYQAMGDLSGAREILAEVIAEGNESQAAEAEKLMQEWKEEDS